MNYVWIASLLAMLLLPPTIVWLSGGRSLGKWLFGLRIVRTDGLPMTFTVALKRGFVNLFSQSLTLLLVSISSLATDRYRRSKADESAHTIVVHDE